jgi:hypothetical protein
MRIGLQHQTGSVHRDLERTLDAVLAADGVAERAIAQAGWVRRGLLGRLVKVDGETSVGWEAWTPRRAERAKAA